MSSQNQTTGNIPTGNMPLNCPDCNEIVRKTADGTYRCTGCGHTSKARPIQ